MKRMIVLIICAILIGVSFAIYMFLGISKTFAISTNKEYVSVFQIGAFKSYDNAINKSTEYPSSIIIKDDNLYRVFIGMAYDKNLINKYKIYYDKQNVIYYEKKLVLKDSCINKIIEFEKLVMKSSEDIYDEANKKVLEIYKNECHD